MRWELLMRILVMAIFGLLGWEGGRAILGIEQVEQMTLDAARVLVPSVLGGALLGFVLAPWITTKPATAVRASLRLIPTAQLLAGAWGWAWGC